MCYTKVVTKEKGNCSVTDKRYNIYKEDIKMAHVISDECVSCGSCAAVCPADAISEGDGKYVIDADACLDCGTCEAECPNEAIHPGE